MEEEKLTKEKLNEYKNHKWFACAMDYGFIASANTLNELLQKFGRNSAKYIRKGEYEFKEGNSLYAWTVHVYKGYELPKLDGYDIDYNNVEDGNSWHLNK